MNISESGDIRGRRHEDQFNCASPTGTNLIAVAQKRDDRYFSLAVVLQESLDDSGRITNFRSEILLLKVG